MLVYMEVCEWMCVWACVCMSVFTCLKYYKKELVSHNGICNSYTLYSCIIFLILN